MTRSVPGLRAISPRPYEILLGDVTVTLDAPSVLDQDVARKGLGVAGVDGAVRFLAEGRRAGWLNILREIARADLPPLSIRG